MARSKLGIVSGAGWQRSWCGVSESTLQIATSLRPDLVITTGSGRLSERLQKHGINVAAVPLDVSSRSGFRDSGWRRVTTVLQVGRYVVRCLLLLIRCRVRVVYIIDSVPLPLLPVLKLLGFRVAVSVRGEIKERRYWVGVVHLADAVVCLSREMEQRLRSLLVGYRTDSDLLRKITVISNAVERRPLADGADIVNTRIALPSHVRVIVLMVGSIWRHKDQLGFVEQVIPVVHRHAPNVGFVFVGAVKSDAEQAYETEVRRSATQSPAADSILFVGEVSNVGHWYRAADIVVLTSRGEGQSRTLLEAVAFGRPFVTFAVQSAQELAEESGGGIVVPSGRYEDMAIAIMSLASDTACRREMGRRAADYASRALDPKASAECHRALLGRLGAAV